MVDGALVVLDTHALIWWTGVPELLGRRAAAALRSAERVGIPAICFWETALLVRKRRLQLGTTTAAWAATVRAIPRVEVLDLTADIALAADALVMHDDPADRFILSTARAHAAPLLTKDALLRRLRLATTVW